MKYFSNRFCTKQNPTLHTSGLIQFDSLTSAIDEYIKFVKDCEHLHETPMPVFLYRGVFSKKELKYGVPEEYTYVLRVNNRNNIICERPYK